MSVKLVFFKKNAILLVSNRTNFNTVSGGIMFRRFTACTVIFSVLACIPVFGQGHGNSAPPAVVSGSVSKVSESDPKRYVGAVEAIKYVDIMPRITGNLLTIHFKEGEIVEKGALLYELEDTTYIAAQKAAQAQLMQAEAQIKQATAQIKQAEATFAYAEKNFKREKSLKDVNARKEFDAAQRDFNTASANKAAAEAGMAAAIASKAAAEAALLDANNNLSYTKIYAPITGRIGKSQFTEGNLITPAGGKLTDISMIAPIYVRFSISEKIFRRDFGGTDKIKERAAVRIRLADNTLYPETASVALIDNKVNVSSNTITLWAVFENKDYQLIPGSFVSVMLSEKNQKTWCAISPSAMILDGEGHIVYVLDKDNRAEARRIRLGGIADGKQIVLEGLDGSERIICEGSNKVRPGMIVAPVPADQVK